MNNYDDLSPAVIRSGLKGRKKPKFHMYAFELCWSFDP